MAAAADKAPAVFPVTAVRADRHGATVQIIQASHVDAIEELFAALPDALARRRMLDVLEKEHKRLLAHESKAQNLGVDPNE